LRLEFVAVLDVGFGLRGAGKMARHGTAGWDGVAGDSCDTR
jgi:hypothetical protein